MMNFMVLMRAMVSVGSLVCKLIQVYALNMQSFLWDHHLRICFLLGNVFGWWGLGESQFMSLTNLLLLEMDAEPSIQGKIYPH